jgi:hypothetical protein
LTLGWEKRSAPTPVQAGAQSYVNGHPSSSGQSRIASNKPRSSAGVIIGAYCDPRLKSAIRSPGVIADPKDVPCRIAFAECFICQAHQLNEVLLFAVYEHGYLLVDIADFEAFMREFVSIRDGLADPADLS